MENLYKGEIGRLDFFKYLLGCCILNWILSTVVVIVATTFSPYLAILYAPAIFIWLLILFNYKKRGMSIFKNEIISWILAGAMTLFSFLYGIWQLAFCIAGNLYNMNKISHLPFWATNESAISVYSNIGIIGIIAMILLLIYLFVPEKKTKNE